MTSWGGGGGGKYGGGGGLFRVSMCGRSVADEMEQISREGSHYSITSGILPSLGARSNRRVKLRRFTISPYDRRYSMAVIAPKVCQSPSELLIHQCWSGVKQTESFLISSPVQ